MVIDRSCRSLRVWFYRHLIWMKEVPNGSNLPFLGHASFCPCGRPISTTPSGKGWKSSEIQALADRFLQVPDMFPIVSDTPNISDLDGSGYPGWCMVVLDAGFKICQQFSRKCSAFCCLHQPWTVGLLQTLMPGDNHRQSHGIIVKASETKLRLELWCLHDAFMMLSWCSQCFLSSVKWLWGDDLISVTATELIECQTEGTTMGTRADTRDHLGSLDSDMWLISTNSVCQYADFKKTRWAKLHSAIFETDSHFLIWPRAYDFAEHAW